jgi:hypothetical protein
LRGQVLFVPSNGVGLGHVGRLLAVARRLDAKIPAVFASLSPALHAIQSFGFLTEYIPSHHYLGGDHSHWDQWLNFEIGALLEEYDAGLLVYDGNNPTPGLIAAARSRNCKLAWIRRGMWGTAISTSLDYSDRFDLIVEPGELAESRDGGATAARKDETVAVDPIRLLDEEELLPRDAAARDLGLDTSRPAVLIQLGSGFNRDTLGLTSRIIDHLRTCDGLQIVIADWLVDAGAIAPWDDVKVVRGFPLAQYFRAFDFSISAAGYNTFHDVISYALPTLFIANRHPSMDDQAGRAKFAQDRSAAFEMSEDDLGDLPQLLQLFLNEKAREFLRQRCVQIARPNGAKAAARELEGLLSGKSTPARAGRLLLSS